MGVTNDVYEPNPKEIKDAVARIREGWTDSQHKQRLCGGVVVPVPAVDDRIVETYGANRVLSMGAKNG